MNQHIFPTGIDASHRLAPIADFASIFWPSRRPPGKADFLLQQGVKRLDARHRMPSGQRIKVPVAANGAAGPRLAIMLHMDRSKAAETAHVRMLTRCIELSRYATSQGENPFACMICQNDQVVAEATTRAKRDADVTRHAETIAISDAQKILGTGDLSNCTIYSTVEPCAMCSFCIRETKIGRVVYCIPSPVMGGLSKWNILGDPEISNILPEVFHKPPEIVSGLLVTEAEQVWREWHPIDWAILRHRHILGDSLSSRTGVADTVPRKRRLWDRLRSWTHPAAADRRSPRG